jgi:hypothetical protein
MNVHHLKTWPIPFTAIWDGLKPYEVRQDDRNFQVGDELVLQIWDPGTKTYGNRTIEAMVTYKTASGHFGVPSGVCVLGLGNVRRIQVSRTTSPPRSPIDAPEPEGRDLPRTSNPLRSPTDAPEPEGRDLPRTSNPPSPKGEIPEHRAPSTSPSSPVMGFSRMNYETFQKYIANLEPSRLARVFEMYHGVASASAGDVSASLHEARADRDEWKRRAIAAEKAEAEQLLRANDWYADHSSELIRSIRAEQTITDMRRELGACQEQLRAARAAVNEERLRTAAMCESFANRASLLEVQSSLSSAARSLRALVRLSPKDSSEEGRRAEGEGRMGSPSASIQPRSLSETAIQITHLGDGPDTRRCTRWAEPVGTVGEMLDQLTVEAPTKTPYHAWLRGKYGSPTVMSPVNGTASLAGFVGETLLVYAEGREADRLAYGSPKATPSPSAPDSKGSRS